MLKIFGNRDPYVSKFANKNVYIYIYIYILVVALCNLTGHASRDESTGRHFTAR